MATVLTQDAVLHFLQSGGGSVKNSDLLAHFRNFIRDHADRDRNRELFKKFVNSVATVRQEDGVSLVVLRKQFRAGRVKEASPQRTDPVPTAKKPRPKPQPEQSGTHAPAGETARGTVLPAAGITINNNNNVEASLNVKQLNSTPGLGVRSAAAPVLSPSTDRTQTSSLSERPLQDQCPNWGQARSGLGPLHGNTPVAPPVRTYGETRAQVPAVPPVRTYGETRAQVPAVPPVRTYGETRAQVPAVPPVRTYGETRAQVPAVLVAPPVRPHGETRQQVPVTPVIPVAPPVRPHGETTQQVPVAPVVPVPPTHRGRQDRAYSEGGLLSCDAELVPRRVRYRPSYKSAMSCDEEEEVEEEELPVRQRSGGAVWPVSGPLTDTARTISTSSPCILDRPAPPSVSSSSSSKKQMPKIFVQDVEWDETLVSHGPERSTQPGLEPVPGGSAPTRRSRPSEVEPCRPSPEPTPHQDVRSGQPAGVQAPVQLSSSHSSSPLLKSEARFTSDWPSSGSSEGHLHANTAQTRQVPQIQDVLQRAQGTVLGSVVRPSSSQTATLPWQQSAGALHDDQASAARGLHRSTAEAGQVPQIQDVLQRAQGTMAESVTEASAWHQSAGNLYDDQDVLHLSTGDLLDRNEVESSDGSASTPRLLHHLALPRRLSREVRDRMCRSLGTDLDQMVQDDVVGGSEAARLNRLHLISSSLSLRGNLSSSLSSCSTPPRCRSLAELDQSPEQKGGRRSLPATAASSTSHQDAHGGQVRQSLVPLEPREHSWYVKAAAGAWPDIYSLFREDSSLLNKQDFISGFTVLHWIAKHGDHRVLNTLWYGVEKAGLAFNVDARSLCGYTPLHIAAIHGNKNIMRLLVKNFSADVKLRDMAGKRPWQYLGCAMTPDIFQLLGAPARAALQGTGISDLQQPQQSRRRRHHLSTASSGERPSVVAGVPKVKRSTSLAAFLKHKSLLPFHGQQSDAVI